MRSLIFGVNMNNTEKLMSLIDWDSPCLVNVKKDSKDLFNHFRERTSPKYLFDRKTAKFLNNDKVFEEAERVMNHDIFGVKFEGEINYLYNPTVETSRDNEWSWSLFRTIYWQSLARAYALSGDEKYVKEFLHQMHQFIETWPAEEHIANMTFEVKTPFPGHAWRTIETGIRVYTTWLPCFEIFKSSPSFTDEDMATFLLALRDHARFLMTHYSNHDRSSNWLSMEASALYQIGVMFPEFKEASEWKETGYQRVMHEILYCFSNKGVHMEKTPIYHLVAAIAFTQAVVLSKLNGIPVPDYAMKTLERAAYYVLSLVKPDLSTPMIGDADRDDFTTERADTSVYEGMNLSFFPEDLNEIRAYYKWMYELTGNEAFLWVSTLRKEGREPEKLDYEYPDEGVFVVRTGWGQDDDYLLTHSTVLERGEKSTHSHNDSAHAELSLKGEDILVDSGRYIYRSSIWKDWRSYFCSALAHNTLFVDDHEMGEVPNVSRVRGVRVLRNEFREYEDGIKMIDISHNGYAFIPDSVFHRRKLMLLPKHRALIIDYVTGLGKTDHDFRIMLNFNRGSVSFASERIKYQTEKGTKFDLLTNSDVPFKKTLLSGSEEPKGGWISYGYPVRVPSMQVTNAFMGKAPFIFVTSIAEESDRTEAINIKGNDVEVLYSNLKLKVREEGLEVLWK